MFSKSKTKRFQDPVSSGPAPGQYNITDVKSTTKAVVFEKDKRWKEQMQTDGSMMGCSHSSMENLSVGKGLIPICQSTCMKKPNMKSKRRTCFVSSSASDLTSRLALEDADVDFQAAEIKRLQARIMFLESEIMKLKASKSTNDNDLPASSMDMDEIMNEKLSIELKNRCLEEKLGCLEAQEASRTEEMRSCIHKLKEIFTNIINSVNIKYSSLERLFCDYHVDYQKRLERAKSLLDKIKVADSTNIGKIKILEKEYDDLVAEQVEKEGLFTKQESQLAEFTNEINLLSVQLKSKEESCINLNMQLDSANKVNEEKVKVFSVEKENILKQITGLESIHESEVKELNGELLTAQNLNIEYRQQIENVELSMTDNIRELSRKYECLEETFDQAQKYYQKCLERSNSLVQKTVVANKKSNEEFENLQKMYALLQQDFGELSTECENKDDMLCLKEHSIKELSDQLMEKDKSINDLAESMQSIVVQLSEKNQLMQENENSVKLLSDQLEDKEQNIKVFSDQLMEKDKIINCFEESMQSMVVQLSEKDQSIEEHKNNVKLSSYQLEEKERNIKELSDRLIEKDKSVNDLAETNQLMTLQLSEKDQLIQEHENSVKSLSDQLIDKEQIISELKEAENCDSEWKAKYEELERKVGPFMDQLEQFSLEKRSLLDQNSLTQQEMKKLSEKYAQILGHQNNKQKIRHISKLKDENLQLKNEVMKLRSTASKDKLKITNLESKLHEGKRFDPAKSFQHGKENRDALRSVNS